MVRKVTSLLALFTFILTIATSLVLYIAPQGRVAYWSDWTLLGLDKTQWGDLHINLGTLFLLALALHAYYNWKAVVAYLSKARQLVLVTPAAVTALVIVLATMLGTLVMVPPFSTLLAGSDYFKDRAARVYGEPPFGHAELSPLTMLAPAIGLTPDALVAALHKAGYPEATVETTLQTLARAHKVSPHEILAKVAPAPEAAALPATPPAGTGNLTLTDFCQRYGLETETIVQALSGQGLTAKADMTIRAIGEQNGVNPLRVYAAIRQAAGK